MNLFVKFRAFARSYLNAGIDGDHLESSHRASLVNGICFSTSFALALLVVVDISRQAWIEFTADIFYLATFQLPVVLNRFGRIRAARRCLMLMALFAVTSNSMIMGSSFMSNSLYIPVAAVACLIFPPQERWFRRFIAFGAFFLCLSMQYFAPVGWYTLPEHDLILVQNIGTILVFGLICAACFHASKANFLYVEKLRASFASESNARNQAHAAARLAILGELSAGVAHEINNPLAVIVGRSEMLRHEIKHSADSQKMSAYANTILEMSSRISAITKSMLGLARPAPAKAEGVFSVQDATSQVLDLFTSLNQRQIFQTISRLPENDPLLVKGDYSFYQQIVLNLLTNARDALKNTDAGTITISAFRENGQVIVTVSDNGCGIPAEISTKIMDPFFTTKEQGAGTGLGLSISKGLALSMGASLHLTANANPTTFTLILPDAGSVQQAA